jgi:hypothetical protein
MKRLHLVVLASLLIVAMLGIRATVLAGSEGTSGVYNNGAWKFYYNDRYVSNPALPGPEVAFYLNTYSPGLYLGTSYCGNTPDGPIYYQYRNNWNPVAYFPSPRIFCVVTWGSGSSGTFAGTIAWD